MPESSQPAANAPSIPSIPFFATLSRLRWIRRWNLMMQFQHENVAEHSFDVAVIAQGLAVIGKYEFHEAISIEAVVNAALLHDMGEALTGDMPTPIKKHRLMAASSHDLENKANHHLLAMLPEHLRQAYQAWLAPSPEVHAYVKAADDISAYLKCLRESALNNSEFSAAKAQVWERLEARRGELPALDYFITHALGDFEKNIDALMRGL